MDFITALKVLGVEIFDAHELTDVAILNGRFLVCWDPLHFYPFVYRELNKALLSMLVNGNVSYNTLFKVPIAEGSLIKIHNNRQIYLYESGKKRPIKSASVFLSHGWNFDNVSIVSHRLFDRIDTGNEVT